MKNILLVLTMLVSVDAFAQDKTLEGYDLVGSHTAKMCTDRVGKCRAGHSGWIPLVSPADIAEVESVIWNLIDRASPQEYQYDFYKTKCSVRLAVIIGNMCNGSVHSKVYCKSWSYSEIAILRLFESCKKNPQASCFDPKILATFDKIKPSKSRTIDKSTKCFSSAGTKK